MKLKSNLVFQCITENLHPQSMFWADNKKNNVYPCKPQFYCVKVEFKGLKIIEPWFRDDANSVDYEDCAGRSEFSKGEYVRRYYSHVAVKMNWKI